MRMKIITWLTTRSSRQSISVVALVLLLCLVNQTNCVVNGSAPQLTPNGIVNYSPDNNQTPQRGVTRLRKLLQEETTRNGTDSPPPSKKQSVNKLRSLLMKNTSDPPASSDPRSSAESMSRERALALQQYRVNRNIHTRNLISYGSVSGGTTDTQKSKDSIHIAGFFPTSSLLNISSEGAIGRGVLPAVKLAIYHINNNNYTLPDYKLHISWNDTKVRVFFEIYIDECKHFFQPITQEKK